MKNIIKFILLISVFIFFSERISFPQQSWIIQYTGTNNNINAVFFTNYNTGYAACDGNLLLKTTNGGTNWFSVPGSFSSDIKNVKFFNTSTGLVFTGQGIFKTTNAGLNWELVNNSKNVPGSSIADANTIYASYSDEYAGIMKSTDKGSGWGLVYPISRYVPGLAFPNSTTGFAIAFDFGLGTTSLKLYNTTDAAIHWNMIYYIYSSLNHRSNSDIFFTGTDTGYFTGEDNFNNLIFRYQNGIVNYCTVPDFQYSITFANGKIGWSAGENGNVYKTTNAGVNWIVCPTPVSTTLLDITFINELTGWVSGINGVILKTTNGGVTSVEPKSAHIPNKFSLSQNYPNPFNPTTKIKFEVAPDSRLRGNDIVTLKIFDVLGREVTTLVNEKLSPGTYEVEWDAGNYPSGVYFYRLITSDFTQTKKMVLVK